MTASREDLLIRIDASIEGLRREMARGDDQINRFEKNTRTRLASIEGHFDKLGRAITTRLLPILSAAVLGRAIQATIDDFSRLRDVADTIGLTTSTLQELRYVGIDAGLSMADADTAVEGFAFRVAEAQEGTGALRDTLRQYRIEVKDANGENRDTISIMRDLADAISQIEDPQERLRVTREAFGKSAGELVNVFSKGSEEISRLAQQAHDLGIVVDEEIINRADEFGKRWEKASLIAKANFQSFVVESMDFIALLFNRLDQEIDKRAKNKEMQKSMRAAIEAEFSPDKKARMSVVPGYDVTGFAYRMQTNPLGEASSVKQVAKNSTLKPLSKDELKQMDEAATAAQTHREKILGVVAALEFRNQQVVRSNENQELYNQLQSAGVTLHSKEGQEIEALVSKYNVLRELQQDGVRIMEEGSDASEEWGLTFSSAIEDAIANFEDLGSVAEAFFSDLARMVARKGAVEPLADLFSGVSKSAGSWLSGLFSGGLSDGAFSLASAGNLFSFANGGVMTPRGKLPLRTYKSGGIANSPQLALYGEGQYNEAYVPLPDGKSIPVTLGGTASGGHTVINQSFSIDMRGADEGVMKRWPQMKRELLDEAKRAVASEAGRGGSFAKAVGRR